MNITLYRGIVGMVWSGMVNCIHEVYATLSMSYFEGPLLLGIM